MVFFVSYEMRVKSEGLQGREEAFVMSRCYIFFYNVHVFLCHQESVGETHRDLQPEQKSVWHHVVLFTQPAGRCRAEEDVRSESACS